MSHRDDYLDYEQMTALLKSWAEKHPDVCRLQSLGKSGEGRELWLLVVGRAPERVRPALWIDGNMHAMELSGSSVALALAQDLIALHRSTSSHKELGVSAAVKAAIDDSLVYVLPRMSPDGAEAVLKTGRYVRSVPVDDRPDRGTARWKIEDVDGDGLALAMRVRDDSGGDFVESRSTAGLMLARSVDDEGPFYKMYPEGTIIAYDGKNVPAWQFYDDNRTDLNRNFPWGWAPEGEQAGAGAYAASTPESRAVVEFASRAPHLMAWINLHTFGGCYIRPLGHQPDNKMDREDMEIYRQIAAWVEEHTGYATVSGYEEFLYQPDKPLRGDISDFAYHQLGCLALAVELWDLMAQAGLPRKKPFIDNYQQQGRADVEKIAAWDREHNGGRTLRPWTKVKHPQLGDVEVGGVDSRFSIWNPPREKLDDTCKKNVRVFLRLLAMLPRVHATAQRQSLGGGGGGGDGVGGRGGDAARVEVVVENRGYLATHGMASAKKLQLSEPLAVEILTKEGKPARSRDEHKRAIGHLDGWGRGLYGGAPSWPYQTTTAPQTSRTVSFVVDDAGAPGSLRVRVGSCRVGFVELDV